MTTSDPNPGERVKAVHVSEDTLSVDLADGRTITVPLAWFPRLFTRMRSSEPTGGSPPVVSAFTGPMSMRTSAPPGCSVGRLR
jgi:hypothetical protein